MKPGSAPLLLVLLGGLVPRAAAQEGAVVSAAEYEGWRQYSVQCARCHGQAGPIV
jgi:mono/diheme cytochrome c family protein